MAIGLDDYEFQLDNTGVLLNSDGSGLPFVDITRVVGLDSPEFRETVRDHEGVDGSFIDAEFEKGRDIILEGTVYCDTSNVETYLDDIKANYAPVRTPIPLFFKSTGVDERVVYVKPRGVRFDWDTARRIGVTNIQFLMFAEDPRIYTNDLDSTTIAYGGDTGVGFAFSFGFDLDFGGGSTPGGGNVNNTGNRPTPVEFIINGPVTNPVIINTTTNQTLRFSIDIPVLETLTINTNYRTVYLNGNVNRRNVLTTAEWIFLDPGTNFISFGGLTGVGSSLEVNFRSAWR